MSKPASDKQLKFISDLVAKKDFSSFSIEEIAFLNTPDAWETMSTKQASTCIERLLNCSDKPKPVPVHNEPTQVADVLNISTPVGVVNTEPPEPGYYFIVDPTDNKEKFYRVRKGKKDTRWENHTFLDVQASDFWYPVKDANHRDNIYAEINRDPVDAMNLYGQKLGRCGVCNRTLTDRDSRLQGIGPICAARLMGAPTEADLDLLSQFGLIEGD